MLTTILVMTRGSDLKMLGNLRGTNDWVAVKGLDLRYHSRAV